MSTDQTPGSSPPIPPELRRDASLTLKAHAVMDQAWDLLMQVNAESENPAQVACGPGCAACCSYLVDTISTEAELIAASMELGDPAYKAAALERLLDWEYEFMRWLQRHPVPDGGIKNHAHDLWRGSWQIRRIACPFLDMDSFRCTIYADRPATCRGHHACYIPPEMAGNVSQPPDGCFTSVEDIASGKLTPIWMLNAHVGETFSKILVDTLEAKGVDYSGHLLPLMVLNVGRAVWGWPRPNPRKKRNKPPRITVARKT